MKTLFSALVLLLCGCATSYQSDSRLSWSGGFTDTQLAPDVFRIVFKGNIYTSPERAQDFALLRASELAQKHLFGYFAVIDQKNGNATVTYGTPSQTVTTASGAASSYGNIYVNPYGGTYSGTTNISATVTTTEIPGQNYTLYFPESGLLVRCFQTRPEGVFSFDAKFLEQSIKKKHDIK